MGNCQSDRCDSEEDGVKKSNLESGSLQLGSIFTTRSELITAANEQCHSHGKACRVYRNQKELIHVVCVHQYMAMKRIDKSNALARKSFIPMNEDDKYQKEEYPLLCRGHIKANPLKKSLKKNAFVRNKMYSDETVVISQICSHTCEGPPPSVPGSRSIPHNYHFMACLASNAVLTNPSAKPKWIGNVIEDKVHVSANTYKYMQYHRMKHHTDLLRWGDTTHHYGCVVHLLESMKEFDPDSRIFLKVFPDMVNPNFFRSHTEYRRTLRGKNTAPEPKPVFALRFGSIAVTMGSSVRRHTAASNRDLVMRNVRPLDATFLTSRSRGTSCDIIQLMAAGEITLETLTADAENESQNVWSFAFEADKTSLGARETSPRSVFVGDRLKGQDTTLNRWFPNIGKEDCVFHLKENMREPKNGHANKDELALFDLIIHSATMPESIYNTQNFIHLARPSVANYVQESIFRGNSNLSRYCDAVIMNSNHTREREGIRSSQGSESFHFANIEERSQPLPFYIAEVYGNQYMVLQRMLQKYKSYREKSMVLPPSIQEQIDVDTGLPKDYFILRTGANEADVSRVHGGTDPNVHHIKLREHSFTCDRNCLERNGSMCSFAIMFMLNCSLNPIDFVPEKYTVKGGIKFLEFSLASIENKKMVINYPSLTWSTPHILPPHARVPKGRPRKKRMTKGCKRKRRLVDRYERRAQQCIDEDRPIPETEVVYGRTPSRCFNCGGDHYRSSCRSPNDGMGNTITTDAQNDSLSGGFLIIEIQRLGETVLPIDLDQYHAMRETSAFSTTSFNVNEVLSDDEDGALFNIESQVEDEYDDGTDKKIECKAEKVPFRDDILTQVEDNDDNEDDEPQNIYSHIDQEEHCEQSSDEESKESDTDICDSSSEKSVLVGAPVLEGACIVAEAGSFDTTEELFWNKKEAFTFSPKCTNCNIFAGTKIGNPLAQKDSTGTSKYDSFQNPQVWFDIGTVISSQLACYHEVHNDKVSLFTHAGDPYHNPHGYFAIDDDACIQESILISTGEQPKPQQIDMTQGYERHVGIVFGSSHFAVIDFVLTQRIIIVHDGLRRQWKKQIQNILKYDLSILGGECVFYTYASHALRRPPTAYAFLDSVRTWVKRNENVSCGQWLVLHADDFNKIKKASSDIKKSSMNSSIRDCDALHSTFSPLSYRPEIIQKDGGYVCGALACIALENLLYISDQTHCDETRKELISVNALPSDNDKSRLLRKGVMDQLMARLHVMKSNNEIDFRSNQQHRK